MAAPVVEPEAALDVPVTDTPERRPPTRLHPGQLDFVAMSLTNGVPIDEIASAVRCEPAYIKRLASRANESFNAIWDGYRDKLLGACVQWRFKLAELLPLGYQAIEHAITQTKDPKLAAEQAWRVLEAVVPAARPTPASVAPTVQVNLNDARVQSEVTNVLANLGETFANLKSTLSPLGADRHLRTGSSALVQAPVAQPSGDDEPPAPWGINGGMNEAATAQAPHTANDAAKATLGEPVGSA